MRWDSHVPAGGGCYIGELHTLTQLAPSFQLQPSRDLPCGKRAVLAVSLHTKRQVTKIVRAGRVCVCVWEN